MAARSIDAALGDARDGAVGRAARVLGRADLDDAADPRILDAGRVEAGDIMSAPVDAVDHDGQVLAQLVGQIFVDDAAGDRDFGRGIVNLEGHRIALRAVGLQRLVHVSDDVAALAQLAQRRFHPLAEFPDAWRVLGGEPHLLQLGETARAKRPVELATMIGQLMAQVEEAVLGFPGHGAVDVRVAVLTDLGRELAALLDLGDGAEFKRRQIARPLADAVGEIVAVDDEVLAQLVHAAHDDMDMRMAGVVVIDRNPIELRAEIGFHLGHEVACIGGEVGQVRAVLGRDDEAELVAIVHAALDEGNAIMHLPHKHCQFMLFIHEHSGYSSVCCGGRDGFGQSCCGPPQSDAASNNATYSEF
ncbi:hypothetical protein MesoLjLc_46760 [Mesorhizobium sp. L-8-10]|nr:hypothetical protein MesoLjLc_46760 [Mesorhizobium sp. L-8-10]